MSSVNVVIIVIYLKLINQQHIILCKNYDPIMFSWVYPIRQESEMENDLEHNLKNLDVHVLSKVGKKYVAFFIL